MDFKKNFFTSGVDALMELGGTSTLVSKEVLSSRDQPRVAADGMDVLLGVASSWAVSVLPILRADAA